MSFEAGKVTAERDWPQFVARADFDELAPLAQGLFVKDAMRRLKMTKEEFARRIGVSTTGLEKWMARHGTSDFRNMPSMAWKFIAEILEHAASSHRLDSDLGVCTMCINSCVILPQKTLEGT
ncbi:hypothetical protein [Ralstonia pseudosolanacearum]|uniref:hypothetical protein n=1 Tax=Ralstonia pseudosolanacearum TaxID=1310165 RepID=UPI001FFA7BF7|nr:hypothetical protein [Ralstonia pseudosolanacearum]